MPHVTFIHGIANKIEPGGLEQAWLDALRDSGGPDLLSEDVSISMCYWADVLYAEPLADVVASMEAGEEAEVAAAEDVGQAWYEALPAAEKAEIEKLAAKVGAAPALAGGTGNGPPVDTATQGDVTAAGVEAATLQGFERIPLPGPLKRRMMRAFLRDVHHYLWNVEHSPRAGETFQVRTEVRRRAVEAMRAAEGVSGPHVVVGHSLGCVIAYDVLQNVKETPTVDAVLTLGSPLGIDEVQDRLDPGWSRQNGFPSGRLTGNWINVYDRLDPVCGLDPVLANDYRRDGNSVITDINEPSWGAWRHAVGKYFRGQQLRAALIQELDL